MGDRPTSLPGCFAVRYVPFPDGVGNGMAFDGFKPDRDNVTGALICQSAWP